MNNNSNNLNQDNYNVQGNNGMSNNQPLNNQNLNQVDDINSRSIDSNIQQVSFIQQKIIQESNNQTLNNFDSLNNNNKNENNNNDLNNLELNNNNNINYQNNSNNDNQNIDNNSKKKGKKAIVIIIIIILIVAIIAIYLITKGANQHKTSESNNEESSNTNENVNNSTVGKYVIFLNDMKITLGETTMDYIARNTDLKVVKDSTERLICNSSTCEVKEGDVREIVLSDGTNNITIKSYFGYPNKPESLYTSSHTDDPSFNISTGTKLVFVDNAIGKKINIGDSFTEDEYYNIYNNTGTCFSSSGMIQCSQTKLYANDFFAYWLDDNYKIINMSAHLLNY